MDVEKVDMDVEKVDMDVEKVDMELKMKKYTLTPWGQIASNINEIHPLIASTMISKWNWFHDFNISQLVSLFSIFTDVNVPEDFKRLSLDRDIDGMLYYRIHEVIGLTDYYAKYELDSGLFTGIQYDILIMYDLIREMNGWIKCDTEEACKYFIQTAILGRGISVGDFTKAILKIAVITKEFIGVCEMVGDMGVELLYKLKMIEPVILKYIATSQSLYV